MARDYYAILGVTPASEDVVIRAAYRALMRHYHPDTNPSSEALQRVQAINAAYAVLSDPEKRTRYDGSLAAQGLIRPDPQRRRSFIPRPGPAAAIGFAALAAAMVAIAAWQPIPRLPLPSLSLGGEQEAPRPIAAETVRTPSGASVETASACGNSAASGLIRDELFRRAVQVGGGNAAELGRVAPHAVVRIESPTSRTASAGAAGCHGFVAIDLPPGLVVDGGRSNLTAEIVYGLVETSGGDLRLANLTGTNRIVRSLATLSPGPRPAAPVVEPIAPVQLSAARPPAVEPAPAKSIDKPAGQKLASASDPSTPETAKASASANQATNQASFSCKFAKSAAEKTICGSSNLSALDRQAALLYSQSWGRANDAKRTALLQTRADFVDRRNKCGSEACMTSAYVARMREMADIMAGRRQP